MHLVLNRFRGMGLIAAVVAMAQLTRLLLRQPPLRLAPLQAAVLLRESGGVPHVWLCTLLRSWPPSNPLNSSQSGALKLLC